MKSSKKEIITKVHKIPALRFDDQQLTSFAGTVLFQPLFDHLNLKARLKSCFHHVNVSPIFGHHLVALLLIVHLLLGFRRLRDIDWYRDDPLVCRLLGMRKLPTVSTISRALSHVDTKSVEHIRALSSALVIEGLQREAFPRVTLDFDGSVLSTKGHREGTAIGFNPKKKGARSYYPLFCTVAQTGQFLDLHHRPGNVHDSNGAAEFMLQCFQRLREHLPNTLFESRIDSAFFDETILALLEALGVEFTATVPFLRFPELKDLIEHRQRWRRIDGEWSYFETDWNPTSWNTSYRFLFVRKRIRRRIKGPLQLDLFEPRDFNYEYKVIVTNKRESAKAIILFHNGRGSQEGLFAEAKQQAGLGVLPSRRLAGNQVFTVCAMIAHNLSREIQMLALQPSRRARPKRPAAWGFETLGTLRHRVIQRAGRLTRPQGELTLTLSANPAVKNDLLHFLDALQKVA